MGKMLNKLLSCFIGLLLATLPEPLGPVITRSDVSFNLFIQI